jgi:nitrile hydratase
MNGVHDMGGMHGLGAVTAEVDEPLFHAQWESRVLALVIAMAAWGRWNIDNSRHQRELIPGPEYLRMSYYERWLTALVEQIAASGLATRAELTSGVPDAQASKQTPPLIAQGVERMLCSRGRGYARAALAPACFQLGAEVRVKNAHPLGHTRVPRYVRGKRGSVIRTHGAHVLPDSNAHFQGERPEPLYGVRFDARELWGDAANPCDSVYVDLWESYLEPA